MSDQRRDKEGQNCVRLYFGENLPHAQHKGDNYQGDLCKELHNSARCQSHQGLGDGRATLLVSPSHSSQKPASSHKQRISHLDVPKPYQQQHEKMPLVPPSNEFSWFETNCGWFILYRENVDTNIQIRSRLPFSDTYILAIADTCIEFSSLADAVLVANAIALAFKDSLPVKPVGGTVFSEL